MNDKIKIGDVVQIKPEAIPPCFSGCLMVVTELNPWGVIGYVPTPLKRNEYPMLTFYKIAWNEFTPIGGAAFIHDLHCKANFEDTR